MGRGTTARIDGRIDALLSDAANRESALVPHDNATRKALYRRVARGGVISPLPGLFVRAKLWESFDETSFMRTRFLVNGLAALHPGWTFCHVTAADIHGLGVSYRLLDKVHVVNGPHERGNSTRLVTRHRVREPQVTLVEGKRVTSLQVTVLDCLRSLGFREGLVIADAALAKTRGCARELASELQRLGKGLRGVRRAVYTASHADGRSESGGESLARASMIWLGYVVPELQVIVDNPLDGKHPFRVDFLWILPDGTIIICEVDGEEKRTNPSMTNGRSYEEVLSDERQRESLVSVVGARIIRVGYADIMDAEEFARRLDAFGVPKRGSAAAQEMERPDSAMHGGRPAPNGVVIRNGKLSFERPEPAAPAGGTLSAS